MTLFFCFLAEEEKKESERIATAVQSLLKATNSERSR
jgi:hypothetical protein